MRECRDYGFVLVVFSVAWPTKAGFASLARTVVLHFTDASGNGDLPVGEMEGQIHEQRGRK